MYSIQFAHELAGDLGKHGSVRNNWEIFSQLHIAVDHCAHIFEQHFVIISAQGVKSLEKILIKKF